MTHELSQYLLKLQSDKIRKKYPILSQLNALSSVISAIFV